MNLKAIQTAMSHAVVDPESQKQSMANELEPSSRQSAVERLEIYTKDYWFRCLDSLSEDFPKLEKHWGEDFFVEQMKAYLSVHPSKQFTLFYLGENLLPYIEKSYHLGDREKVLALAEWDWAELSASIAKNAPAFNPSLFSPEKQNKLAEMPLEIHPSVTITKYQSEPTIIYRKQFELCHQTIHPLFYELMVSLKERQSLQESISSTLQNVGEAQQNEMVSNVQSWFQIAVQEQWFVHP